MCPLFFLLPHLRHGTAASHVVGSCFGLFYWIIAASIKRMAPHNPPQGHERSAKDTMAFNCVNSILGTGGRKAAYRGKQGGDKELVCPDQEKKKGGTASLQKIFHESFLSCIRSSWSSHFPSLKDQEQLSVLS